MATRRSRRLSDVRFSAAGAEQSEQVQSKWYMPWSRADRWPEGRSAGMSRP